MSFAYQAYALDPALSLNQYAYATWNAPYGRINAITQSADGYLWIGTESGLIRFDGQVFQHQDSGDFSLNILGLAPDKNGGLWVRSLEPSLLRYRDAKFTPSEPNSRHDSEMTAIAPGRDGATLFASKFYGVFAWKNGWFRPTVPGNALPRSPVTSIMEARSGDVWLGTVDAGAVLVHEGKVVSIQHGLPSHRVTALLAGTDDQVYIGTDRGLVRGKGTTLSRDGIPQALRDLAIVTMLRDRDGNVWIGSEHGLARLDPRGAVTLRPGRSINALFEDREGDLWAGSTDYLERIQETPFTTYPSATDEKGGPVHADARGDVWFASGPGVIGRIHNSTNTEYRLPALHEDRIYSIAGDADD